MGTVIRARASPYRTMNDLIQFDNVNLRQGSVEPSHVTGLHTAYLQCSEPELYAQVGVHGLRQP